MCVCVCVFLEACLARANPASRKVAEEIYDILAETCEILREIYEVLKELYMNALRR